MKVCFITNILAPYRVPLFSEIASLVDRLDVILMARGHSNRSWELPAHNFRAHFSRGLHVRLPHHEEPYHVNWDVGRILKRVRPDVIVSGGFTFANVLGFLYAKSRKCAHYTWGELTLTDGAERSNIRTWLRRWMVSGSTGAIGSSTVATAAFRHYGSNPSTTLLSVMPIDVGRFKEAADRFRSTEEFSILRARHDCPIILCVSRLVHAKGLSQLIAAFVSLSVEYPTATLLIAGDGPDGHFFTAQAEASGIGARVAFLGFLQVGELAKYYAAADLFVFPTLSDTFGAVLSEAMAAGTLSLASVRAAAAHDLIEDGVTGLLFDPVQPQSMVDAMSRALKFEPVEKSRMIDAARQRVARTSHTESAKQIVEFIERTFQANY